MRLRSLVAAGTLAGALATQIGTASAADDGYVLRFLDPGVTYCDETGLEITFDGVQTVAPAGSVKHFIFEVGGFVEDSQEIDVVADQNTVSAPDSIQPAIDNYKDGLPYTALLTRMLTIDGQETYTQALEITCTEDGPTLEVFEDLHAEDDALATIEQENFCDASGEPGLRLTVTNIAPNDANGPVDVFLDDDLVVPDQFLDAMGTPGGTFVKEVPYPDPPAESVRVQLTENELVLGEVPFSAAAPDCSPDVPNPTPNPAPPVAGRPTYTG